MPKITREENLKPTKLVLISMYGHLDSTREKAELDGKLNQYIPAFVDYLAANQNKIAATVLCGGLSREDYPIEESVEVLNYIYETETLNAKVGELDIFVESESLNMLEQMVFGMLKTRVLLQSMQTIIFICDKARETKAKKLLGALLSDTRFDFEVVTFERGDIHPQSSPEEIEKSTAKALEQLQLIKPYFNLQISNL